MQTESGPMFISVEVCVWSPPYFSARSVGCALYFLIPFQAEANTSRYNAKMCKSDVKMYTLWKDYYQTVCIKACIVTQSVLTYSFFFLIYVQYLSACTSKVLWIWDKAGFFHLNLGDRPSILPRSLPKTHSQPLLQPCGCHPKHTGMNKACFLM